MERENEGIDELIDLGVASAETKGQSAVSATKSDCCPRPVFRMTDLSTGALRRAGYSG
ncbi:MAG TPA: benenodin family lasso peptide [Sphingomonas sp.]|nr:benenodin family lasso peptide [Sphingomonas sp.]